MPGFQCLHNPRPVFDMNSVRVAVKHSGGVAVFVNDSWLDCVSLWKQSTDGTRLWLQFQRLGAAPLFLAVVYAPPKGSPYANEGLFDNIATEVGMIQDLGGSILLTGDFNARTSELTTMLIIVTLQSTCLTRCHWGMTSRRFCLSNITRTRGG